MAAKKKSPKSTSINAIIATDNRAYIRAKEMKEAKARRNKPKSKTTRASSTLVRSASAGSQSTRKKKR